MRSRSAAILNASIKFADRETQKIPKVLLSFGTFGIFCALGMHNNLAVKVRYRLGSRNC